MEGWQQCLASLPEVLPSSINLKDSVRIGNADDCDDTTRNTLRSELKKLLPWRKGPFELFGNRIDSEWRSDWKWDRLKNYLRPLAGRTVLDVGCGNGYYCLRMIGAGAKLAVGIDPTQLYVMQFQAIKKYLVDIPAYVLPLGIEHMPQSLPVFDTVFSMGVIYHRKKPSAHLQELKNLLRPGGELVLETLIIDGAEGDVLVPEGRYAKMRNVWAIPSMATLEQWLIDAGFKNVRVIDLSSTPVEEQRSTDWMRFESLSDFLDPKNSSRTIEGHPAPKRTILLASKP
jgi:tRNA (mo5U34)-methyltransferase